MDNQIILAVAGAGKTTYIVEKLTLIEKALIVTYTNNNYENLRKSILEKFGFIPPNISIKTYFSFIHSFCYLPFLKDECDTKGILFKPNKNLYAKGDSRYISKNGRLYFNRISKYISEKGIFDNILKRIERYFDILYFDEIQDFAGHDFNFLSGLSKLKIPQLYVGDFYQHTFDTSRDGAVNRTLHDNYLKYKGRFEKNGFTIDEKTLSRSYRCGPAICKYITENLGINIKSHKIDSSTIQFVDDKKIIKTILFRNDIIKLFYQKHYSFAKYTRNWGDSKGENHYQDICVSLNDSTLLKYNKATLQELPEQTKNKLYVALTRANRNVFMVPEKIIKEILKEE